MKKKTVRSYLKSQYPGHSRAYLSEFFGYFETLKTDEMRVKALREFLDEQSNSKLKINAIRSFVECLTFDQLKLDLPEGIPDGIKFHSAPDQVAGSIWKSMASIGYFIPASNLFIHNPLKRERVFLSLVENMHEGDARLFCAMKDRDFSFVPGLTHAVLHAAYPGWVPAPKTIAEIIESKATKLVESVAPKNKGGRPKGSKNIKKTLSPLV